MLTKLTIRNFKQFGEMEIPLANGVVFVGPNNSGKTSALQALALWYAGLQAWTDRRLAASGANAKIPKKRSGVTVNRQDLLAVPVDNVDLLWRNRRVRSGSHVNVRIELVVEGLSLKGKSWKCGLEFDYASRDAIHCRPLRTDKAGNERMDVPDAALEVDAALLPPMSGLAAVEAELQPGRIDVLLGEGQTAQVLRNICYRIRSESREQWEAIISKIEELFGVRLLNPERVVRRGEIQMAYTERGKGSVQFGLSSAGRGMQQVLLLLAFLSSNQRGATLLVDEPDAHLEILRQQNIYQTLLEAADKRQSQIIAASHSEVLLNEAAARKAVVAFVGKPHLLAAGRTDEVLKSLKEIGFDQYYLAEQRGWALYLEGETDLDILRAFAMRLDHPAQDILASPFCKTVQNQPDNARRHFNALREACPGFVGILLVDGDVSEGALNKNTPLEEMRWRRREAENYLCTRRTLLEFAASWAGDGLWTGTRKERRAKMENEIRETERASARLRPGKPAPFSADIKASDEFLNPLFEAMPPPLKLRKADFHKLVPFIPDDEVDPEIREKLDAIHAVAMQAKTPQEDDPDD